MQTWSMTTFLFYLAIILLSYGVSKKCTSLKSGKEGQTGRAIIIVMVVLLFVRGFGTSGTDIWYGYYADYMNATTLSQIPDQTTEIGYRLLTVVCRNLFGGGYWAYIFLLSVLTLLPIALVIYQYRDKLDASVAFVFYTAVFYFQGFSLIRIYLAAAIALLSYDAVLQNKPWKALLMIGISMLFHKTMICLILPYGMYYVKKLSQKQLTAVTALVFLLIYFCRPLLSTLLVGRYSVYQVFADVDIGMIQFLYYIPLFILYFFAAPYEENKGFARLQYCFILSGLFFGLIGYIVPIMGRLQAAFLPLILGAARQMWVMKKNNLNLITEINNRIISPVNKALLAYHKRRTKQRSNGQTDADAHGLQIKTIAERNISLEVCAQVCFVFYCVARYCIYIFEYYGLDGIMPYTNIFGWII